MRTFVLHPQLAADTHLVAALPLCDARLMNDANHPWLVLVPRIAGAVEMIDLTDAQRTHLRREIDQVAAALRDAVRPDKLNIATLGNMVQQLHVHVIARYRHDVAWPKPVWGAAPAQPYAADALAERIEMLRVALRT
ncbi:HIT domain-containing protein [Thermomonas brevis]